MKLLLGLFLILITTKDCKNTKAAMLQESDITITYQASSRGVFDEISISNTNVMLCNDVNRKVIKNYTCSEQDWKDCLELLENIDIASLPKLKAPTSDRLFDGAAHATLTIKNAEGQVSTNSFDHGQPPAEIKALVEKLLSIKKVVSKQ